MECSARLQGTKMWKAYHLFKAFSSALRGNLGWATYHSAKAIAWKTKRKNPHKAQQNLADTKEASTTLQGIKIYLKGVDRTNEIKHFSMDKDKSLRVRFIDNDKTYTYLPQNYEIKGGA